MKKYLSREEIDFYKNQGAIVIKDVFRPWIDLLRTGFEKVLKEPGPHARENAKNEEGRIKGLLADIGMEGFTTPETHGKWSLRASATGELVFDNVKIPKENILPNQDGLGAPLGCLDSARYGIAWGTIGSAMDCYDTALRYAKERVQFGKPIASFQLQQKKISEIITEFSVSRFPVGSSAKINSGFIAIALAIATLCCSPPDN